MSEWNFGNAIAEEASEQLRERVREAEAERDRAIERTSSLVEALAQQWADRSKAMGERDAALAEVASLKQLVAKLSPPTPEGDRQLDAALARVAHLEGLLQFTKLLDRAAADLDAGHLQRDRKRDEALGKIAKQSCNCGEYDQHEVSCPVLIAREALKEV